MDTPERDAEVCRCWNSRQNFTAGLWGGRGSRAPVGTSRVSSRRLHDPLGGQVRRDEDPKALVQVDPLPDQSADLTRTAARQPQGDHHATEIHVAIQTETGVIEALSLAPMAVLPAYQRQGIGTKLVQDGLRLCRAAGHRIVLVLGHPGFYPRFGFYATMAEPLSSPFGGGEAWMAVELVPGALAGVEGTVEWPEPFGAL